MSVVHIDTLDEKWLSQIRESQGTAVGPDGLPLDIVGEVVMPICLGKFQASQKFTVVRSLTTNCILGADFLLQHGAVIDCRAGTLVLGNNPRCQVYTYPNGTWDSRDH